MIELSKRRKESAKRIGELKARLTKSENIAAGKACVYATGSFGRFEASGHSDLDLFILGKSDPNTKRKGERRNSALNRLDDIRIKAELIESTRAMHFPEFSGDGKWLTHYGVDDLTHELGTQEDDSKNTFTARLLLLLESHPLVGVAVYEELMKAVISAYWRDYEGHEKNFMPAFLSNDILRLWRTFCVNYEARSERVPAEEKAKGKIKNYKLKHSRLLTCYSALLCLLAVHSTRHTVSPEDAFSMFMRTPTERLESLLDGRDRHAASKIAVLLDLYDAFLKFTNQPEADLVAHFMDREKAAKSMSDAYAFGDAMYEAMETLRGDSQFYRLLVV